jgi:hypothetical protein
MVTTWPSHGFPHGNKKMPNEGQQPKFQIEIRVGRRPTPHMDRGRGAQEGLKVTVSNGDDLTVNLCYFDPNPMVTSILASELPINRLISGRAQCKPFIYDVIFILRYCSMKMFCYRFATIWRDATWQQIPF